MGSNKPRNMKGLYDSHHIKDCMVTSPIASYAKNPLVEVNKSSILFFIQHIRQLSFPKHKSFRFNAHLKTTGSSICDEMKTFPFEFGTGIIKTVHA